MPNIIHELQVLFYLNWEHLVWYDLKYFIYKGGLKGIWMHSEESLMYDTWIYMNL